MGIDIKAGGRVKKTVRQTTANNPYNRLLCKLYKFLARRTDSKFNKVINKRLNMTRTSRPPLSLSKIAANMANKDGKLYPAMRDLDDEDLRLMAGYILVSPKVQGSSWGGGKIYF
jgi:ribosomal protein L18E